MQCVQANVAGPKGSRYEVWDEIGHLKQLCGRHPQYEHSQYEHERTKWG